MNHTNKSQLTILWTVSKALGGTEMNLKFTEDSMSIACQFFLQYPPPNVKCWNIKTWLCWYLFYSFLQPLETFIFLNNDMCESFFKSIQAAFQNSVSGDFSTFLSVIFWDVVFMKWQYLDSHLVLAILAHVASCLFMMSKTKIPFMSG